MNGFKSEIWQKNGWGSCLAKILVVNIHRAGRDYAHAHVDDVKISSHRLTDRADQDHAAKNRQQQGQYGCYPGFENSRNQRESDQPGWRKEGQLGQGARIIKRQQDQQKRSRPATICRGQ